METVTHVQYTPDVFLDTYTISNGKLLADYKNEVTRILRGLMIYNDEDDIKSKVEHIKLLSTDPEFESKPQIKGSDNKVREVFKKLLIDDGVSDLIIREKKHLTEKFVIDYKDLISTLNDNGNFLGYGSEFHALWRMLTPKAQRQIQEQLGRIPKYVENKKK
ncbi:hypothetical protein COB64_00055 [Candidatus Wolfebacteria bacterium]|nr:MAG: hypothetical protein COB64_00055 [Candidatus Wolfebacteria bacterium]